MLVLDSDALSAIAHRTPARRHNTVRALISQARDEGDDVVTSAAVLAEVIRGRPRDAAVHSVLRREQVRIYPIDNPTAIRAGQLLGAIGAGSEMAVDAFVMACAEIAGGTVVATVDGSDMRRLATHSARVQVVDIG